MKILLATPNYTDERNEKNQRAISAAKERLATLDVVGIASSFLTYNFNRLWCMALNNPEYTHFVMLHADIVPRLDNWLSKLVRMAGDYGADVLSAVCPLKMDTGQTSTALAPTREFGHERRLTMREVMRLPETFYAGDVAKAFEWNSETAHLRVNTGLMVVRLNQRAQLSQMCFMVNNWIRQDARGKYYAVSEPEDWAWSREADARGLRVMATRAVGLAHIGANGRLYPNDEAWGTMEHEDALDERAEA